MCAVRRSILALVVLTPFLLVGCNQGSGGGGKSGVDPAQWAALQEAKQSLDALRLELRELQEEIAALPAEEPDAAAAGEEAASEEAASEGGAEVMTPAVRLAVKESEVAALTEEFGGNLVNYINALGIPQGQPLTPEQQAAMSMKSEEDIELAREWIEKGGDYRRAIEIYQAQLLWDPDYAALKKALAKAEEMRFMTEERFAAVEKGMARSKVRELLGPVNLQNIREFPEKDAIGWFYPKDNGGAAGIYFKRAKKSNDYEVYDINFEAVKPRVIEADGTESTPDES